MQRVIIFEGPDRTGKTNIAQEVSRRIGIPYFKNDADIKNFLNPKDYFVNTLRYADPYFLSYLAQTKSSVIIDRHYPSEWVYSKVFKRKTDMKAMRRTDDFLAELGAKIVITWRSDYSNREDDQFPDVITEKKLQQIHDGYVAFREWTKCESIWLNVDDENLNRETDDVLNDLDLRLKPLQFSGHIDPFDLEEETEEASVDDDLDEIESSTNSEGVIYPNPDNDWSDVVWDSEEVE